VSTILFDMPNFVLIGSDFVGRDYYRLLIRSAKFLVAIVVMRVGTDEFHSELRITKCVASPLDATTLYGMV
jgi:hypothetical protein